MLALLFIVVVFMNLHKKHNLIAFSCSPTTCRLTYLLIETIIKTTFSIISLKKPQVALYFQLIVKKL